MGRWWFDRMDRVALWAIRVHKAPMALWGTRELRARPALQETKALEVRRAQEEQRDLVAPMIPWVLQE
jgi:hypothetical protein